MDSGVYYFPRWEIVRVLRGGVRMIDWIIGGSIFTLVALIIIRKIFSKKSITGECGNCSCGKKEKSQSDLSHR